MDERDRFVDDPKSPHYNTWQRVGPGGARAWKSAEKLSQYQLAVVIHHNTTPVQARAGSAIFLHVWASPTTPTAGCTSMARDDLITLIRWLDPSQQPLLVQLPGMLF